MIIDVDYNSPSSRIIGFDGSRAFQEDRTGTENYSYQLLKALAKIDQKNTYRVYLRPQTITDAIVQVIDGFPSNFQFETVSWPRFWTQGGLCLQTFKDKLDVLFVPAHTLPVIYRPGLKTVVTVHDTGSEYLPSMHQVKQRLYLSFMQKVQLKTATKIIAVSKATKEDLVKKLRIDPKKIRVVYEGYDKSLFKPVMGDTLVNSLRYYNLQPKTYYLFVGTVQPRKNLERLIKAFSYFATRGPAGSASRRASSVASLLRLRAGMPSSPSPLAAFGGSLPSLVIAGSKGWLSDEIYNAAAIVNQRYKKRSDVIASDYKLPKKLGIEDRVKFLGYVPDEDLPALYSGAIAFIFPSLFEGFGLPILEAQASGCPVLTSNVSSMPEVAGGGAVFVDPYSVDDIVKGMVRINNQETRNKLVKAGFENIKRFSWEQCAQETLKVLEKAI